MRPIFFPPQAAIQDWVENVVILEFDFTEEATLSPIYAYVPSFTRFLCFYLADQVKVKKKNEPFRSRSRSIIIGQQLKPVVLDLGKKHLTVYVSLKPFAMYRLLGIPQYKMIDQDFDSRDFFGVEIDDLVLSLQQAATNDKRNEIMQKYLAGKNSLLRPSLPIDIAISNLISNGGNLPVEEMAGLACLSVRQYERTCKERLGLSPKLYSRLVRFTLAYQYKEKYPAESWTKISHEFGYYDQTHLIRDFKFFAGINPGTMTEATLESSVRFQIAGRKDFFP